MKRLAALLFVLSSFPAFAQNSGVQIRGTFSANDCTKIVNRLLITSTGAPCSSGSGTVTSVSVVTANGVSGSVATSTTTPAITITLGAITPSSVVASGNVSAATTLMVGSATPLTLTAGAIGVQKITASASAPGAAGVKLEAVCGTNAGTAKLVMYAGTSGTAITVVDNVGAGVTGC